MVFKGKPKKATKKRTVSTRVASAPITKRAFVSSVKNVLKKDAEVKYNYNSQSAQVVDNTPTIYSAGAMAQGVTNITRIGNSVQCKGFQMRINFASVLAATVRVIVFTCEADASGMPTITLGNILLDTTNPVNSVYNPNYVSNFMNSDKPFKVLYDKHQVMAPATPEYTSGGVPTGASVCNAYMNIWVLFRRKIAYGGTGGALADIIKNPLFYTLISDNAGTDVSADWNHILYYTDA
jgi:hypothetical protein